MTRRSLMVLVALLAPLLSASAVPLVQLRLDGTAGGQPVSDQACYVRLLPGALEGWDPNDATKLFPLGTPYSLLASSIQRNGAPYRVSVNSLPDGRTTPAEATISFYTTAAGTFTITWTTQDIAAGWDVFLRDLQTGTTVDLQHTPSYAFTSDALADWVDRFQLTIAPAGIPTVVDLFDGPGWRLLSAPVPGLTVTDLAARNLVQGVPAGTVPATYPAQYPSESTNLFTSYTGVFEGAADAGTILEPGRGFYWYWYDADFGPFAGGTSASRDLRGEILYAAGTPLDTDVTRAFPVTSSGAYMLGNPFAEPFAVSGLSVGDGLTLSTVVQAYDPDGATYRALFQNNPGTGTSDVVAPWQGFFGEVSGNAAGTAPTFTYAAAAAADGPTPPFYGRSAGTAPYVHLQLNGTQAGGTAVADAAAWVRVLPDAADGPDRHDLGKQTPPGEAVALVALVESGRRLAVASRPDALTHVLPVAFQTTTAGTFTLGADASLADGWQAVLRDAETGAQADLTVGETLAFASDASDWTERFTLVLTARGVVAAAPGATQAWTLSAPVPNPAAGRATLTLDAATGGPVTAVLVDALGRTVSTLFEGDVAAGARVPLGVDAADLAPGVYVVRVTAAEAVQGRLLVVTR